MHTKQGKQEKYKKRRKLQKKKTEFYRPAWKSLWKWENVMTLLDAIVMFTSKHERYNRAQRFVLHCFT
jgi:hypothetical protein